MNDAELEFNTFVAAFEELHTVAKEIYAACPHVESPRVKRLALALQNLERAVQRKALDARLEGRPRKPIDPDDIGTPHVCGYDPGGKSNTIAASLEDWGSFNP